MAELALSGSARDHRQLIALALIAAWAAGDLMTAALLPLVMTLGHILEERSLLGSQEAIRALSRLTQTRTRRLLPGGEGEEVATQALRTGDLIDLRAGEFETLSPNRRGQPAISLPMLCYSVTVGVF